MTVAPDPDVLGDVQWARLAPLMQGGCKGKRGPRRDNRLFMDAVLFMIRAYGRLRDLPEHFGKVGTIKRRFYDWMARGVLSDILAMLSEEADREWVCVDATIVRTHQQIAGARPEKVGACMSRAWATPRSRGGLTTMIHHACDTLGNPMRLLAGPGQQGEVLRAAELIDGPPAATSSPTGPMMPSTSTILCSTPRLSPSSRRGPISAGRTPTKSTSIKSET